MALFKITTYITVLLILFLISSCTVIKNYPQGKPFIYEANVHVRGDLEALDKKDLELQLANQFHDSIQIKSVSKFIGWEKPALISFLPFIPRMAYELRNGPAAFDSLNAEKTLQFMKEYLQSLGYFRDTSFYTTRIDTSDNGAKLKAYVDFYVEPRSVTKLDSIAYRLNADTSFITTRQKQNLDTIQKITTDNLPATLIKKGDPFSKYKLSAERDRLANVYRNNGYLRFSEEELLVLWDTVGVELLRPTIDPIEQATLLQRLDERRKNPVADVEFRLRDNPDSTRITRYYVGKVTVYPEFTSDTTSVYLFADSIDKYIVRHNKNLFKKHIFPDWIFLNPGDLYQQTNYLKTQNKFNGINAWRIVSIDQRPRQGQDTADFDIRLTPARKYGFNTNLEVSRNQGNISYAQGSLIGLGVIVGVQNRNVQRGANQSSLNFRYGTELNADVGDLIQSRQVTLGYSLQIPRLVPKFMRIFSKSKENANATILSLNGGQTDRKDYFSLTSLNTSLGYQFGWSNKLLNIRFPNIEYNLLRKRDSLYALEAKNASYKYIFNTGMIISLAANYTSARSSERVTRILSLGAEISGLGGLVKSRAFNTTLYQFLKLDAEYRQTHKIGRNSFAWRVFGGVGFATPGPTDGDTINRFLPFFRQYFAGGPASMRAWSIRKLGPGSTIKSFEDTDAPDRFGDMRIEANAEYRIHLFNYGVIGVQTALFTDIGNIWLRKTNPDFPDGEFPDSFSKLWKDIGIGVGTGLRVDLSTFLKIRLDYAYKLKNPTPDNLSAQNKWAYDWQLFNGQVQLGIDYPF